MLVIFPTSELDRDPIANRREFGVASGVMPNFPTDHAIDIFAIVKKGGEVDLGFANQAPRNPTFFGHLIKGI